MYKINLKKKNSNLFNKCSSKEIFWSKSFPFIIKASHIDHIEKKKDSYVNRYVARQRAQPLMPVDKKKVFFFCKKINIPRLLSTSCNKKMI